MGTRFQIDTDQPRAAVGITEHLQPFISSWPAVAEALDDSIIAAVEALGAEVAGAVADAQRAIAELRNAGILALAAYAAAEVVTAATFQKIADSIPPPEVASVFDRYQVLD